MALVNINFTVLAHAYVLYARALQSRIRGGTFAAPVRPAFKKWYGDAHHCKKWYGVRRTSRTFYGAPEYELVASFLLQERPGNTRTLAYSFCSKHKKQSIPNILFLAFALSFSAMIAPALEISNKILFRKA